MTKDYKELLKDPKWEKKREEILKRDNHKCRMCHNIGNLHVHHHLYIKGRKPWEYDNKLLTTLCVRCHKIVYKNNFAATCERSFNEIIENFLIANKIDFFDFCFLLENAWTYPEIFNTIHKVSDALFEQSIK